MYKMNEIYYFSFVSFYSLWGNAFRKEKVKSMKKSRSKKLVALVLVTTLLFSISLTAQASWYGFVNDVAIYSGGNIISDEEYVGTNVGGDIWTYTNEAHTMFNGKSYTLTIEKKGWWAWQWDTVATEKGIFGQKSTIKAYNVGDGRYRFVITFNGSLSEPGVYVNKFESYSWD